MNEARKPATRLTGGGPVPETPPQPAQPATTLSVRSPWFDALRGLAIIAMIVYHTAWDLSFLGLVDVDVSRSEGWRLFARAIAASFLAIAGASLVVANAGGFDRAKILRRLIIIGGAAAAVSAGTLSLFPNSFVFFGILHAIALFGVLGLPLARAPWWLALGLALTVLAVDAGVASEAMSHPFVVWLGLGTRAPISNDFVPVFPWLAAFMAGMAAARALDLPARLAGGEHRSAPRAVASLARLGRHSLIIYLLHQPLLFGALSGVAALKDRAVDPEARAFMAAVERECVATGGTEKGCAALATCAVSAFRAAGLWDKVVANTLLPEERAKVDRLSRGCAQPMGQN